MFAFHNTPAPADRLNLDLTRRYSLSHIDQRHLCCACGNERSFCRFQAFSADLIIEADWDLGDSFLQMLYTRVVCSAMCLARRRTTTEVCAKKIRKQIKEIEGKFEEEMRLIKKKGRYKIFKKTLNKWGDTPSILSRYVSKDWLLIFIQVRGTIKRRQAIYTSFFPSVYVYTLFSRNNTIQQIQHNVINSFGYYSDFHWNSLLLLEGLVPSVIVQRGYVKRTHLIS